MGRSDPAPESEQEGAEAELRLIDEVLDARRGFRRDPVTGYGRLRDALLDYQRLIGRQVISALDSEPRRSSGPGEGGAA